MSCALFSISSLSFCSTVLYSSLFVSMLHVTDMPRHPCILSLSQVAALQAHVTELRTENASFSMHVEELEESNKSLVGQLDVLKGSNLDSLTTVAACEHLEAKLKQALSAIDKRKVCTVVVL